MTPGNFPAIIAQFYASDEVLVTLMHALIDRDFLRERLGSFHLGYRLVEGVALLRVSDNVHALFLSGEPALCSSGYVYVVEKQYFVQATDSTAEWYSLNSIVPLCALKVPATLSELLFVVGRPDGADSVLAYSPEEMRRIQECQTHAEGEGPRKQVSSFGADMKENVISEQTESDGSKSKSPD